MDTQHLAVVALSVVAGLSLVALLVTALATASILRAMMGAVVAMAERKQVHRLVQEGEAITRAAAAEPAAEPAAATRGRARSLWKPAPDSVIPNGQPDEAH